MSRSHCPSLLAAAVLLVSGGCAALPLSSLSSLSSLGASTVTAGRDTYSFGKLHSAELAEFWSAEDAARLAAADLGLRRSQSAVLSEDGTQLDMAFVDDEGAQIGVRIERRTPKMLFLREDIGIVASFFGAEVTDRLFLLHLRQHLPRETAADTRPAPTQPSTAPVAAVEPAHVRRNRNTDDTIVP